MRRRRRRRKKRIGVGVACAVVCAVVVGAGIYYRTMIFHPSTTVEETEEQTPEETETETEKITVQIIQTEAQTTTEAQTELQPETGNISSGTLPPSPEYFIVSEDADRFFERSVFIGDSVMMGFRNFVMGQPEGFLGAPEFLVSGSFSVRMALNTISKDTIHPIYQGEQHYIWDSISMMGAEKVFMFFGLNDIGMEGVDGTCENYLTVINKIREVNPDVSIYVLSTTNMLSGSEKGKLNNDNIRLLNEKMKTVCDTGVAKYIDIASFLAGEDGGLKPELCSDEYVHQTPAAYEIWTQVLRGYASGGNYLLELPEESTAAPEEDSSGETEPPSGEQETQEMPETGADTPEPAA